MSERYFIDRGSHLEERGAAGGTRVVPFPVCLAIKHGDDIAECPDFLLNIDRKRVFVKTDAPLPEGSHVVMHFYIPPEDKLLAEVRGKVIPYDHAASPYPRGMLIQFSFFSREQMRFLDDYLEGRRRLIDKQA